VPSSATQRTATPEEAATLRGLLASAPSQVARLRAGAGNAVVFWAASMLAIAVLWLVGGWLAGKMFGSGFGLRSPETVWVLGVAAPVCALLAVASSVKWVRRWPDPRPLLNADLAQSSVTEESYVFTEAKRFQEPEHGGLMYFLKTDAGEVFTVFDYESQTRALEEQDPLQSSYRPRANLLLVRAPNSRAVLSSSSSGPELAVGPPIDLALAPTEWPKPETLCDIPWEQLEHRLSRGDA
jgi:hypothetical protein